MSKKKSQAHQQAPWRVQLQRAGIFLLGLVTIALVAGIYLNVSAQTAAVAVETENLNYDRQTLQRQIATLRTEIGVLTSARAMAERAAELGFRQPEPGTMEYVVVEGYPGRQTEISAPPISQVQIAQPILQPVYTQSLWEWFFEGMVDLQQVQTGTQLR